MTALPPLISVSGWSPPPPASLSEGLDDYPLLISSSGSGTVSGQHLWCCTATKMNTDKTASERHYSVLIRHEMIRKGSIKLRTNDSHFDSAHCRSSSGSVFRASKLELRIKVVWAQGCLLFTWENRKFRLEIKRFAPFRLGSFRKYQWRIQGRGPGGPASPLISRPN